MNERKTLFKKKKHKKNRSIICFYFAIHYPDKLSVRSFRFCETKGTNDFSFAHIPRAGNSVECFCGEIQEINDYAHLCMPSYASDAI